MEFVQFEEETVEQRMKIKKASWMVRLLIHSGIAKTRKVATIYLFLVAVVFFGLSAMVFSKIGAGEEVPNTYGKVLERVGNSNQIKY